MLVWVLHPISEHPEKNAMGSGKWAFLVKMLSSYRSGLLGFLFYFVLHTPPSHSFPPVLEFLYCAAFVELYVDYVRWRRPFVSEKACCDIVNLVSMCPRALINSIFIHKDKRSRRVTFLMRARILYTNKIFNALFFEGMKGTFCKILDHLMVKGQITNNVHGNVFFFHLSHTFRTQAVMSV